MHDIRGSITLPPPLISKIVLFAMSKGPCIILFARGVGVVVVVVVGWGGGPMPIFGNLLGEFKSLKFQWVWVGGGSVNPDPLQIFV